MCNTHYAHITSIKSYKLRVRHGLTLNGASSVKTTLSQKSRHTSGDSPTSRWLTVLRGNPPAKFSPVGRDEYGLWSSHGRRIGHQRRQGESGTPQQHVSSIVGFRPVIALEDFRPGTRSHLHVTTACRTITGHFFEDSRFLKLETEPIILTLNFCLRTKTVRFVCFFLVLYVNNMNIFHQKILNGRNHLNQLLFCLPPMCSHRNAC